MTVKRYKQIVGGLQENAEGEYVDYSDYQKLVAENEKLKSAITEINNELYGQGFEVLGWHLNGDTEPLDNWFTDNGWGAPETPATDAAIAEIKAQGADTVAEYHKVRADALCEVDLQGMRRHQFAALDALDVAVNLRAGVKS